MFKQFGRFLDRIGQLTQLQIQLQACDPIRDNQQGIVLARQALTLINRTKDTLLWAQWQRYLADFLIYDSEHASPEAFSEAISCYHDAAAIYAEKRNSYSKAQLHGNLGRAYYLLPFGDRAKQLEQALSEFELAAQGIRRESYSWEWALLMLMHAGVLQYRVRGNPIENKEQAISLTEQALEIFDANQQSTEWAGAQTNLGNQYANRLRGDVGENIERAILCFTQALNAYQRLNAQEQQAGVLTNLASAYWQRRRGNWEENLEHALRFAKSALELAESYPQTITWARTHCNTAILYIEHGLLSDNEQANIHCMKALSFYRRELYPEVWASIQNTLGHVSKSNNFNQALLHFQQAQLVYTRIAHPERWAIIQRTIGQLFIDQPQRNSTDEEAAITQLSQALEVLTPDRYPLHCYEAALTLGQLFYQKDSPLAARSALTIAHEALQAIRSYTLTLQSRRRISGEVVQLYSMLVQLCLDCGDVDAAFEYTICGKGRTLADMFGSKEANLPSTVAKNPACVAAWQNLQIQQNQLDHLYDVLLHPERAAFTIDTSLLPELQEVLRQQISTLQYNLRTSTEDVYYRFPDLLGTKERASLTAPQARTLAGTLGATLVEYYHHMNDWCAFIVYPTALHVVVLPKTADATIATGMNWVRREYATGRFRFGKPANPTVLNDDYALVAMYTDFILPLEALLPTDGRLVVGPYQSLHLLPMNAAYCSTRGEYLIDRYAISFVPNMGTIAALVDRHPKYRSHTSLKDQRLLSVACAGSRDDAAFLQHVDREVSKVEGFFSLVTQLHDCDATPANVIASASKHDVVHFACHGIYDPEYPEQSGLVLTGGRLTTQRMRTELRLEDYQLVSLGTCLGARSEIHPGDEIMSLTQTLLSSGVSTVVAGLWLVDDEVSSVLFPSFYSELNRQVTPAEALRQAILDLRRTAQVQSVATWAVFQIYGLC